MFWINDKSHHNIPLSQSLMQSKALTLLDYVEAEKGEEAAGAKLETGRSGCMKFKERSSLPDIR